MVVWNLLLGTLVHQVLSTGSMLERALSSDAPMVRRCGPCRQFTPSLVAFYEALKEQHGIGFNFPLIFASSDRDQQACSTRELLVEPHSLLLRLHTASCDCVCIPLTPTAFAYRLLLCCPGVCRVLLCNALACLPSRR